MRSGARLHDARPGTAIRMEGDGGKNLAIKRRAERSCKHSALVDLLCKINPNLTLGRFVLLRRLLVLWRLVVDRWLGALLGLLLLQLLLLRVVLLL